VYNIWNILIDIELPGNLRERNVLSDMENFSAWDGLPQDDVSSPVQYALFTLQLNNK
jgi:hypothetical protein